MLAAAAGPDAAEKPTTRAEPSGRRLHPRDGRPTRDQEGEQLGCRALSRYCMEVVWYSAVTGTSGTECCSAPQQTGGENWTSDESNRSRGPVPLLAVVACGGSHWNAGISPGVRFEWTCQRTSAINDSLGLRPRARILEPPDLGTCAAVTYRWQLCMELDRVAYSRCRRVFR